MRALGHDVKWEDPPYPPVNGVIPRYLAGIARDAERVERPHRLQRRTRGFARMGNAIPTTVLEWRFAMTKASACAPSSSATTYS